MARLFPAAVPTVIDAHHHLWRYDPGEYGWIDDGMELLKRDFSVRDLEEEMAALGVVGAIAVQARQSIEETEWLLGVAENHAAILGVVGWGPLRSPELGGVLARWRDRPLLKGLRHVVQDEPDPEFLLRVDFNRGIAALGDTGLVYEILIRPQHLEAAHAFVRRHPQQVFVLDHLAKPEIREGRLQPWRDGLLRLAENANVYCKLSGLVTEAAGEAWTLEMLRPYLDTAVDAFGTGRLMAGSDWPVCLLASSYARWWAALAEWCGRFGSAEREQVFGGTARRVYGLG